MQKTLSFFLFLCLQISLAQEITILDKDTNVPISNVAIYNLDRSKTSISDFNGRCNLSDFGDKERITFKHLSYQIRKVTKKSISTKSKCHLLGHESRAAR